jgi:hypothetical protein
MIFLEHLFMLAFTLHQRVCLSNLESEQISISFNYHAHIHFFELECIAFLELKLASSHYKIYLHQGRHFRSITTSPDLSTSFNNCSRTAASRSTVFTSIIVSTQASAQAPLPIFVPPSTRRFVAESGTASHRADVGCVSDRSARI